MMIIMLKFYCIFVRYSIFAGSEEIMLDLGVRQAMKMYELAKNMGLAAKL